MVEVKNNLAHCALTYIYSDLRAFSDSRTYYRDLQRDIRIPRTFQIFCKRLWEPRMSGSRGRGPSAFWFTPTLNGHVLFSLFFFLPSSNSMYLLCSRNVCSRIFHLLLHALEKVRREYPLYLFMRERIYVSEMRKKRLLYIAVNKKKLL